MTAVKKYYADITLR